MSTFFSVRRRAREGPVTYQDRQWNNADKPAASENTSKRSARLNATGKTSLSTVFPKATNSVGFDATAMNGTTHKTSTSSSTTSALKNGNKSSRSPVEDEVVSSPNSPQEEFFKSAFASRVTVPSPPVPKCSTSPATSPTPCDVEGEGEKRQKQFLKESPDEGNPQPSLAPSLPILNSSDGDKDKQAEEAHIKAIEQYITQFQECHLKKQNQIHSAVKQLINDDPNQSNSPVLSSDESDDESYDETTFHQVDPSMMSDIHQFINSIQKKETTSQQTNIMTDTVPLLETSTPKEETIKWTVGANHHVNGVTFGGNDFKDSVETTSIFKYGKPPIKSNKCNGVNLDEMEQSRDLGKSTVVPVLELQDSVSLCSEELSINPETLAGIGSLIDKLNLGKAVRDNGSSGMNLDQRGTSVASFGEEEEDEDDSINQNGSILSIDSKKIDKNIMENIGMFIDKMNKVNAMSSERVLNANASTMLNFDEQGDSKKLNLVPSSDSDDISCLLKRSSSGVNGISSNPFEDISPLLSETFSNGCDSGSITKNFKLYSVGHSQVDDENPTQLSYPENNPADSFEKEASQIIHHDQNNCQTFFPETDDTLFAFGSSPSTHNDQCSKENPPLEKATTDPISDKNVERTDSIHRMTNIDAEKNTKTDTRTRFTVPVATYLTSNQDFAGIGPNPTDDESTLGSNSTIEISPETQAGVSAFIASLQMNKDDSCMPTVTDDDIDDFMYLSSESEFDDESIIPETEAELTSFIDSVKLQEKTGNVYSDRSAFSIPIDGTVQFDDHRIPSLIIPPDVSIKPSQAETENGISNSSIVCEKGEISTAKNQSMENNKSSTNDSLFDHSELKQDSGRGDQDDIVPVTSSDGSFDEECNTLDDDAFIQRERNSASKESLCYAKGDLTAMTLELSSASNDVSDGKCDREECAIEPESPYVFTSNDLDESEKSTLAIPSKDIKNSNGSIDVSQESVDRDDEILSAEAVDDVVSPISLVIGESSTGSKKEMDRSNEMDQDHYIDDEIPQNDEGQITTPAIKSADTEISPLSAGHDNDTSTEVTAGNNVGLPTSFAIKCMTPDSSGGTKEAKKSTETENLLIQTKHSQNDSIGASFDGGHELNLDHRMGKDIAHANDHTLGKTQDTKHCDEQSPFSPTVLYKALGSLKPSSPVENAKSKKEEVAKTNETSHNHGTLFGKHTSYEQTKPIAITNNQNTVYFSSVLEEAKKTPPIPFTIPEEAICTPISDDHSPAASQNTADDVVDNVAARPPSPNSCKPITQEKGDMQYEQDTSSKMANETTNLNCIAIDLSDRENENFLQGKNKETIVPGSASFSSEEINGKPSIFVTADNTLNVPEITSIEDTQPKFIKEKIKNLATTLNDSEEEIENFFQKNRCEGVPLILIVDIYESTFSASASYAAKVVNSCPQSSSPLDGSLVMRTQIDSEIAKMKEEIKAVAMRRLAVLSELKNANIQLKKARKSSKKMMQSKNTNKLSPAAKNDEMHSNVTPKTFDSSEDAEFSTPEPRTDSISNVFIDTQEGKDQIDHSAATSDVRDKQNPSSTFHATGPTIPGSIKDVDEIWSSDKFHENDSDMSWKNTNYESDDEVSSSSESIEVKSLGTMEPIDESDNIDAFFARKHTAPEGATTEEIDQLNFYIRKAMKMAQQKNPCMEEMGKMLLSASREGVPVQIITDIFEGTFQKAGIGVGSSGFLENFSPPEEATPKEAEMLNCCVKEATKLPSRENVSTKEMVPKIKSRQQGKTSPSNKMNNELHNSAKTETALIVQSTFTSCPESRVEVSDGFFDLPKDRPHQDSSANVENDSEDENIDDYLAKFAPPEGATTEEIDQLNFYISKAAELGRRGESHRGEMEKILQGAERKGAPVDLIRKIFEETLETAFEADVSDTSSSTCGDNLNFEEKFGEMEEVDDSEEINAFLTRFSQLKAGGHFPDAIVEGIGIPEVVSVDGEEDAVEVDLVHGFVKKDHEVVTSELNEEEKLWSERQEKDLFVRHADFLENLPVDVSFPNKENLDSNQCDSLETNRKQQIAELHDVNDGDAEVYLMDESNVEVAFVDEEEEMKATEKSRNKIKWRFGWQFEKGLHRDENIVLGRKVKGYSRQVKRTTYFTPNERIDALEKMFEEREERLLRDYENMNMLGNNWVPPLDERWTSNKKAIRHADADELNMMKFRELQSQSSVQTNCLPAIGGVAAATAFTTGTLTMGKRRRSPIKPQWKLSYDERTQAHPGYYLVDVNSLYEATVVIGDPHRFDNIPWEERDVKQRFLHEKSIGYVRNWFGKHAEIRLNDRYHEPICHPKSMEMPMENIPEPGEWTEDWYTTWKSRKENPNTLIRNERQDNINFEDFESRMSNSRFSGSYDDSEWEEAPEVGTLCTMRLKIGESVSRVTYFHTSILRKSKWRKKYTGHGIFPDK